MSYYRTVGEIPPKRHTQFRRPDCSLCAKELMGEEGFSFDSALLYNRYDVDPWRRVSARQLPRNSPS